MFVTIVYLIFFIVKQFEYVCIAPLSDCMLCKNEIDYLKFFNIVFIFSSAYNILRLVFKY